MQRKTFFTAIALVATIVSVTFTSIPVQAATSAAAEKSTQITTSNYKRTKLSKSDKAMLKTMFNADYYALLNPDVVAAYGNDANKLFEHFCNYGIFELRTPSADFNVSAYASAYGDLQKAFGSNIMSYYKHYNNYGKNESRVLTTATACASAGIPVYQVNSFAVGQTGAVATATPSITPTTFAAITGAISDDSDAEDDSPSFLPGTYLALYKAWREQEPSRSAYEQYSDYYDAYSEWLPLFPNHFDDYEDSYEYFIVLQEWFAVDPEVREGEDYDTWLANEPNMSDYIPGMREYIAEVGDWTFEQH